MRIKEDLQGLHPKENPFQRGNIDMYIYAHSRAEMHVLYKEKISTEKREKVLFSAS